MCVWKEMGPLFRFPNCKRFFLFVLLTAGVANKSDESFEKMLG